MNHTTISELAQTQPLHHQRGVLPGPSPKYWGASLHRENATLAYYTDTRAGTDHIQPVDLLMEVVFETGHFNAANNHILIIIGNIVTAFPHSLGRNVLPWLDVGVVDQRSIKQRGLTMPRTS